MPHRYKNSTLFAIPAGPSTPHLQDVYFCHRPRKRSHFGTHTCQAIKSLRSAISVCTSPCLVLCGGISGKSFEAPCNMLQGIDHDSIRLQQFHATCNTQHFQHTRCNSVACSKLHVTSCLVYGGLKMKYARKKNIIFKMNKEVGMLPQTRANTSGVGISNIMRKSIYAFLHNTH